MVMSGKVNARPWCNSKNLNITEKTICNSSELRNLDAELEQAYGKAAARSQDYGQLGWLKHRRNTCKSDKNCIASEYRSRISTLLERTDLNNSSNSRPWCSASRLNLTEHTICQSSYLRDLDAKLQVAYGQARAKKEDSGQNYWLRKQRNACRDDESCIASEYQSRISILQNRLQEYRFSNTATTERTTHKRCSENQLSELKAVCVISAVGEHACSSKLTDKLSSGVLANMSASGICSAAASHLIDGSIDPSMLGLSMASGFLDGVGNSLLESNDLFGTFTGVLFKLGSVAMSATSVNNCFENAENACR